MSYLVLARKYRPQTFDETVGQDHVVTFLKKAIISQHLGQAYLFCGPRGVGKTSFARILAKSLNCQGGPTVNPCDQCSSCKEITAGRSFDVIEIDGASNRGIDEIRTLRENVKFAPSYGLYKIYIVDEVHMLTSEAFNALLKTLEEPPAHVKFIFATTEPHKVPATILSRCQRFDFKHIPATLIAETLSKLCQKEKVEIDAKALFTIAKAATGSLRDALSILDQLSALADQVITDEDVACMLGLVEIEHLFDFTDAIANKDCVQGLKILDMILEQGKDLKQFLRNLIEHFRNVMVIKIGGKALSKLVEYPADLKERVWQQGKRFDLNDILNAIDVFIETQEMARIMDSTKMCIEIALARLTYSIKGDSLSDEQEPKAQKKKVTMDILNEKGHLDFLPASKPSLTQPLDGGKQAQADLNGNAQHLPDPAQSVSEISIESIRKLWDVLTSAVSRKKMSVATYLQEGDPHILEGNKLTIGFPEQALFHKETLEEKQNRALIESVIEDQFRQRLKVDFCILKDHQPKEEEPLVKTTLDKFQGQVIHRWHQETT